MTLRHIFALLILLFEGCGMDPLGGFSANPDEGCHIDPLGGCHG